MNDEDMRTILAELATQVALLAQEVRNLARLNDERFAGMHSAIEAGDRSSHQMVELLSETVKRHESNQMELGKLVREIEKVVTRHADRITDKDHGLDAQDKRLREVENLVIGARAIWWVVGILGAGNVAGLGLAAYHFTT